MFSVLVQGPGDFADPF